MLAHPDGVVLVGHVYRQTVFASNGLTDEKDPPVGLPSPKVLQAVQVD
jgi:hypothetical protein